ncbi:hypothetical protein [Methanohalophilus profundi]|nr:hypothetical protein [Methanohalophilus profundi]
MNTSETEAKHGDTDWSYRGRVCGSEIDSLAEEVGREIAKGEPAFFVVA